jgi:predicted nucleic acid-binding protein
VLVDSSVWIHFLRGESSIEVALLTRALTEAQAVWLAPPILQEVLQCADAPGRLARWDRTLGELPMLTIVDQRFAAREAARLYARCRWAGVTPRSANDCLIALHAIAHQVPLLHRDQDFIQISRIDRRLNLVPVNGL